LVFGVVFLGGGVVLWVGGFCGGGGGVVGWEKFLTPCAVFQLFVSSLLNKI